MTNEFKEKVNVEDLTISQAKNEEKHVIELSQTTKNAQVFFDDVEANSDIIEFFNGNEKVAVLIGNENSLAVTKGKNSEETYISINISNQHTSHILTYLQVEGYR